MNKKTNFVVYITDEYNIFRKLDGNRRVETSRVKKIKHSIENIGLIVNPILVNEKYEVVEGQGRLESCIELNIPVYYIKVPGIGLAECMYMNSFNSNWKDKDHILSFADQGDINYINLKNLIQEYGKKIDMRTITNSFLPPGTPKVFSEHIKKGVYKCSEKQYEKARKVLDFLMKFTDVYEEVKGRKELFYSALKFVYYHPYIDNDYFVERIHANLAKLKTPTSTEDAICIFESAYNYKTPNSKKAYFVSDYKKTFINGE